LELILGTIIDTCRVLFLVGWVKLPQNLSKWSRIEISA
jgi:hypothetical protein